MPNRKKSFLKLVWDSVSGKSQHNKTTPVQMDLFMHGSGHSIVVVYFSDIDKKSFSNTLIDAHPSHVIDMRPNPRFDKSGYSRKMAFDDFNKIGAKYMDFHELLGDDNKDKEKIIDAIEEKFITELGQGPFVFLFGKKDKDAIFEEELMRRLPKDKEKWSMSIVP